MFWPLFFYNDTKTVILLQVKHIKYGPNMSEKICPKYEGPFAPLHPHLVAGVHAMAATGEGKNYFRIITKTIYFLFK